MYKCTNCTWEGEEPVHKNNKFCPVCGDNTENLGVKEEDNIKPKAKINMDLNKDGKVDAKDVSIAAKVMRKVRKPRAKKGKK